MTKEEIMSEPIWPSRLIFNAKMIVGKVWKDCNLDEQYLIRREILKKQNRLWD